MEHFLGGNIEENYVFRVTMQCSRVLQRIELVLGLKCCQGLDVSLLEV
jgi:hypothetical protein